MERQRHLFVVQQAAERFRPSEKLPGQIALRQGQEITST
jgi:hypothetical protein